MPTKEDFIMVNADGLLSNLSDANKADVIEEAKRMQAAIGYDTRQLTTSMPVILSGAKEP